MTIGVTQTLSYKKIIWHDV